MKDLGIFQKVKWQKVNMIFQFILLKDPGSFIFCCSPVKNLTEQKFTASDDVGNDNEAAEHPETREVNA